MELVVQTGGMVRCVYSEAMDLHCLGHPHIRRASRVEPNAEGRWVADLSLVGGPVLGPFPLRSDALAAETAWLAAHWLTGDET